MGRSDIKRNRHGIRISEVNRDHDRDRDPDPDPEPDHNPNPIAPPAGDRCRSAEPGRDPPEPGRRRSVDDALEPGRCRSAELGLDSPCLPFGLEVAMARSFSAASLDRRCQGIAHVVSGCGVGVWPDAAVGARVMS